MKSILWRSVLGIVHLLGLTGLTWLTPWAGGSGSWAYGAANIGCHLVCSDNFPVFNHLKVILYFLTGEVGVDFQKYVQK